MSFYGRITEAEQPRKLRRFGYSDPKGTTTAAISTHDVYFYESGHVGFWREVEGDERVLVLAVKAVEVWEETE